LSKLFYATIIYPQTIGGFMPSKDGKKKPKQNKDNKKQSQPAQSPAPVAKGGKK